MARQTAGGSERGTPVPPAAVTLVDFLNSRPYAGMADKLDDPVSAARVLRPFGQENGEPPAQRLELARAVREDLIGLIGADDPADAAADWAAYSGRTSSITFQQDFSTPGQVVLRQVTGDHVVGGITQSVAALIGEGNWSRLHLCANEICREVFYDTTRNRSRRWHSYEFCGNRANVAAYRARAAGR